MAGEDAVPEDVVPEDVVPEDGRWAFKAEEFSELIMASELLEM
jgi:hypothetical protein